MNTRIATLLTLALAATALAQTPPPSGIRRLPGRSLPASRPTSQSYIAPTAKSDDLVESPATNVVKGAFGYTLGAIWDGKIPEEAEPDKNGEVSVLVEAKEPFEPFSSVTLSISTNDSRIACIAAETPQMILAESYVVTLSRFGEIARGLFDNFGIGESIVSCRTNNSSYVTTADIMAGKLYREFLKHYPDDPDYEYFKKRVASNKLVYNAKLVAGSSYNSHRVLVRRAGGVDFQTPDYLQQIWQPFELSADYYPYTGEAVIRFSVRDVEDRTEHTNLVSVAQLKAEREKNKGENTNAPGSYLEILRRRRADRASQVTQNAEEITKLRAEIAQAAQTSKEEAAKRERAINLELLSRGQEPLSPIELTPEEDDELVRKGALAAPAVATQTNAASRVDSPPVICEVQLGSKGESSRYYSPETHVYEIRSKDNVSSISCYRGKTLIGSDMILDGKFSKYVLTSVESHHIFGIELFYADSAFETKDLFSSRPIQLSEKISAILKEKYGDPIAIRNGDAKRGECKWHFEKSGLCINLRASYRSKRPTSEQEQSGLRTYSLFTTIEYIHLPTLEEAIQEGRDFLARPMDTTGEEAKQAAERL